MLLKPDQPAAAAKNPSKKSNEYRQGSNMAYNVDMARCFRVDKILEQPEIEVYCFINGCIEPHVLKIIFPYITIFICYRPRAEIVDLTVDVVLNVKH